MGRMMLAGGAGSGGSPVLNTAVASVRRRRGCLASGETCAKLALRLSCLPHWCWHALVSLEERLEVPTWQKGEGEADAAAPVSTSSISRSTCKALTQQQQLLFR